MSAPLTSPRVLITTDALGGVWTYSLDLARGLATQGIATLLAVMGPSPSAAQLDAAERIEGLSLLDTGLSLDWTAREPAEIHEAGAAIRGLARGEGVDVVHLNSPALAIDGGFGAPVVGACHSCLATWWSELRDGPMPADFAWRTRAVWRGLLACDALIAPSRAFARATGRTYDLPPPRVVLNGRAAGPQSVAEACEPFVLTSGRLWDEAKNATTLDAAAGLSCLPVFAAGACAGPAGARVELNHARRLGMLSGCEMDRWLGRAAIYASAALYEPFGLGVLEAAQAGCALVLSDIEAFRELWSGAAVFVSPKDAQGFATAFDRLAREPTELDRLQAAAQARAALYSADRMTAGVLEVYELLRPGLRTRAREETA